jgi:membrane protein implicated in regulation of membrane protease activity
MTSTRGPVRAGVVAAVGFLALDAVLLVLAGAWMDRPALVVWGGVFAVLAAVPVMLWRRYLKRLDDVRTARHAMAEEIRRLQTASREPQTEALRSEPRR